MFTIILRVLLIYWIISILLKWFRRLSSSGQSSEKVEENRRGTNTPLDINSTGEIEDAEFEEIDSD